MVSPGNVKLVSLSDAVKLAVSGNIEIPGSVIQKVTALSKVSEYVVCINCKYSSSVH